MNISPYLIINGKSSREISGLLIQSLAPISKAPVKTKVETIDGRDGDIVTPLGFNAYDKTVSIGLTYNYDIDAVIEFFNSEGEVIFSNEPDKVYHFAIYNQIDFERLIRFKTAEVVFHVQPFKFSTTETPKTFNVVSGQNITVKNAGNYYANPNLIITGEGVADLSLNGSQILSIDFGEDEQTIIIDADEMNAYAAENAIKDLKCSFSASQASGTPTPSTPIPIVGVDKVNFTRTGKNLLSMKIYDGGSYNPAVGTQWNLTESTKEFTRNGNAYSITTSSTWGYFTLLMPIASGVNYYLHLERASNGSDAVSYVYLDKDFKVLAVTNNTQTPYTTDSALNPPANSAYCALAFTNRSTANCTITITNPYIIVGSTATTYEPYNGTTALINLGGTYYGGSVDVVTGKITLTHKIYDLVDYPFSYYSNDGYFRTAQISEIKAGENNVIPTILCTDYPADKPNGLADDTISISTLSRIIIKDESYNGDETAFNTAMANVKLVAELATPIVVYASNTAEIPTILGVNNIFSDAGDVDVTYKAGGAIHIETGEIVTFTLSTEDYERGAFVNRQIVGNYDNIRLKSGNNTIVLTGDATRLIIENYSRWI